MIGDININSFDYESNNIIKSFSNAVLKDSMFLFITRPVRVTRHSSTVIGNILQNADSKHFLWNCENGYFRSSSYFEKTIIDRNGNETIFKQKINDQSILTFKTLLSNCDWEALYFENHPDIAYNEFFQNAEIF